MATFTFKVHSVMSSLSESIEFIEYNKYQSAKEVKHFSNIKKKKSQSSLKCSFRKSSHEKHCAPQYLMLIFIPPANVPESYLFHVKTSSGFLSFLVSNCCLLFTILTVDLIKFPVGTSH